MINVRKSTGHYDASKGIHETLKIVFFDQNIGIKTMEEKFKYRLSRKQKVNIANNLIDISQNSGTISSETRTFITNWLRTDFTEKRKAFFDVWDLVLKNYLPSSSPVLFRSCSSKNLNGKIASFTGRLECARRFNNGKGTLLICDTREMLEYEGQYYNPGSYKHTFYPLVDVLKKAKDDGGWGFSQRLFEFIGEDEYIMRINPGHIHTFKWI